MRRCVPAVLLLACAVARPAFPEEPRPDDAVAMPAGLADTARNLAVAAAQQGHALLARRALRSAVALGAVPDPAPEVERALAAAKPEAAATAEVRAIRSALFLCERRAAESVVAAYAREAAADPAVAKRVAERALALDPDCVRARRLLGQERFELAWIDAAGRRAIDGFAKARAVPATPAWEALVAGRLTAAATEHVRIEAAGRGSPAALATTVESVRARFLGRAGLDPSAAARTLRAFLVPDDEAQWRRWVVQYAPSDPASWYGVGGLAGKGEDEFAVCAATAREEAVLAGAVAHRMCHRLDEDLRTARDADWLAEGLALDVIAGPKMRAGPCVDDPQGLTDYWRMFGRLGTAEAFDDAAAKDVRAGADPSLPKMFEVRLGKLTVREAVKATALVRWWTRTDPTTFVRVLGAIRRGAMFEKALAEEAGMTPQELDEEWRDAVRRGAKSR